MTFGSLANLMAGSVEDRRIHFVSTLHALQLGFGWLAKSQDPGTLGEHPQKIRTFWVEMQHAAPTVMGCLSMLVYVGMLTTTYQA